LSFGGVGVHPPAAASGEMFDGAFKTSEPFQLKGRFDILLVHVGVGEIAEIGEPIVLAVGEFAF